MSACYYCKRTFTEKDTPLIGSFCGIEFPFCNMDCGEKYSEQTHMNITFDMSGKVVQSEQGKILKKLNFLVNGEFIKCELAENKTGKKYLWIFTKNDNHKKIITRM